ncbi:Methyltransferase domain [Desmophyllum pertusum]|uniref:Methyltransferase domain n=1 Tax=Desmophyllum pertusum TaxID=174260 RepID=A0A9W9YYP5_9CNID|nr:Methyltransferase domain [Desmophyllum pertusum]
MAKGFYNGTLFTFNATSSDEYVKGIYDECAENYDKIIGEAGYVAHKTCTPIFDQVMRETFNNDPTKLRILDAGTGTGIVAKVLQDLGYTNMDALDISQKMLDEAKKLNVHKEFICAPLSAEPIAEIATDQYDALICVGTLTVGHVKPVALDEIVRIVKPGGIIGFTLRKDVYNETVRHDIYKETTKFGYREKMDELETTKKWKLLRCDLIDYHTTMDELRAKCFSLMYQVL